LLAVAVTEEEEDLRGNTKGDLGVQNGGLVYKGFSYRRRAGIFSLFRNSERLAENRFLKAGKAAENTKEKSRQCFTYHLLGLPERVKSKHYIPPPF
jgi:hypothetical protein